MIDRPEPAARVLHVGPVRADVLLVLLPHREAPDPLVRALAGRDERARQVVVVREEDRGLEAEGDESRAREGREVQNRRGLPVRRVVERVREDHAPLGVRVVDLGRLPVPEADDVARLVGRPRREVLRQGRDADDVDGELQVRGGEHDAHRGGSAHHVPLHVAHLLGGFDRDAARVERDALADERDGRVGPLAALPFEDDDARLFGGTAVHGEEAAHLLAADRLLVEDLRPEAASARLFAHTPGEVARHEVVRRRVPEVAHEGRHAGQRAGIPDLGGCPARERARRGRRDGGERVPLPVLRLVDGKGVIREGEGAEEELARLGRVHPLEHEREVEDGRPLPAAVQGLRDGAQDCPRLARAHLAALAASEDVEPGGGSPAERHREDSAFGRRLGRCGRSGPRAHGGGQRRERRLPGRADGERHPGVRARAALPVSDRDLEHESSWSGAAKV